MVKWNLYRFDYARFLQLRPILRASIEPESFASLGDGPDIDAVVDALIDGDLDPIGARQAIIISYCCLGEPLPCPGQFPTILRRLRRDLRVEAGIELLTDALVGSRNMETWMLPGHTLSGFLVPAETKEVLEAYRITRSSSGKGAAAETLGMRRGGLLPAASEFLRRLFDRGLASGEVYRLLGEFLEDAVAGAQGIAVVSV